MAQKRKQRAQPEVRELVNNISADWHALTAHLDELGALLLSKKNVRIAARIGLAIICTMLLLIVRKYYDNQPIVGDQPHYVLMEYSLVHDHDFNLANNFAHHDSNTFGIYPPNGLTPDGQVGPGQVKTPTHQYSIHGVGLPLLLWPGYVLRRVTGMEAEMVILAVAVIFMVYYWSKLITKSVKFSFIASAALFVSYVFYGSAGYIFPDVLIGAIIIASLLILVTKPDNLMWQAVLGVLLGFSVFVHYKMLAFAGITFLVLCYITWTKHHKLPYVTALPLLVLTVIFFYFTHRWFGIWNPSGVLADLGVGLHPEATIRNLSAILFDSARGFISNNPIYLLLFIGLPIWFRRNRETFLVTIVCIAPQVVTFVLFNDWRGGDSPAGRYIMNFLPVLIPALALSLQSIRKLWQQIAAAALFAATMLITMYYIKIRLGWLGVDSPISSPVFKGTPLAFDRWLPQFDVATNPTGHYDWLKVGAWYILLLGLVAYGFMLSRHPLAKARNQ